MTVKWLEFSRYVSSKYSPNYVNIIIHYATKYFEFLENVQNIDVLPNTIKANVIKSLIILSKYLGIYNDFKSRLQQYGIKSPRQDAIKSFLRILNSSNSDILDWFVNAYNVVRDNERLYLRLLLTTGLRKDEGIKCFNKIIELSRENRLIEYYCTLPNSDVKALCHFKYPREFLRRTKNVFISFIDENLLNQIANSEPLTYPMLRKRLERHSLKLRLNELRDYYGTYLLNNGIPQQYIDMLQGRIPVNIFLRHYLLVFNFKDLRDRVLSAISQLEQKLSP
ncbi:MAG: integrase [Candidatus Micrarchaeia archaeon]|uniref:integrase n=1 Tax=Saccharolobus sp. TaxID=2100761 RepID=UPI0031773E78